MAVETWVPATKAALDAAPRRRVRVKSLQIEGRIEGITVLHQDYLVRVAGSLMRVPLWDLEVLRGRL